MVIKFCSKTICVLAPLCCLFIVLQNQGHCALVIVVELYLGLKADRITNLLFTTPSPVSETFFTFEDEGGAVEGAAF